MTASNGGIRPLFNNQWWREHHGSAPTVCEHGKSFDVHCKQCALKGFCACRECRDHA